MMQEISRRSFSALALAIGLGASSAAEAAAKSGAGFVQINRLTAKSGRVAALRTELAGTARQLTTATLYEVLAAPDRPDEIWTIEIWPSAAEHDRSIQTPAIQAAVERCKVLVARFENVVTVGSGPSAT